MYLHTLSFPVPPALETRGRRDAACNRKALYFGMLCGILLLMATAGCGKSGDRNGGIAEASNAATSGPFQLHSNSMAPAWLGPHYPADCQQCGQTWEIAAETYDSNRSVHCPTCRSHQASLGPLVGGQTAHLAADRLLDQEWPVGEEPDEISSWQRLDCVVFQTKGQTPDFPQWTCKRIWGLPGESLSLSYGELWIEGQMYRKTIDQLRQVMVPVARFPEDPIRHWYRITDNGKFQLSNSLIEGQGVLEFPAGESLIWIYSDSVFGGPVLTDPVVGSHPDQPISLEPTPMPVLDDYWGNHSTPRNLVPVNDLMLTIEFPRLPQKAVSENGSATVTVSCRYHDQSIEVLCKFGDWSASGDRAAQLEPLDASDVDLDTPIELLDPQRVSIGGWDGQVWVEWDGQPGVVLWKTEGIGPARDSESITTFSLSAKEGTIRISSLAVHRDLYLREDEREPVDRPGKLHQLGSDEYFVIGDNLPLSRDSRNELGPVHTSKIIGKLSPSN